MIGWKFSDYFSEGDTDPFERLFKIFKDLLVHTSGDVAEAISWLTELDKHYKLTDKDYGIADFIKDLLDKGLINQQNRNGKLGYNPTSKMEIALRRQALDDIFDQLKKSKQGNHTSKMTGQGDEFTSELRPFEFGDKLDNISISETLKNAQINHGLDDFKLTEKDLQIHETYFKSQTSTVLMIDISHSMILYGEDRITPAKKVAMALSELIITRYPKDTLDIIVFGDDAWSIEIKDLPY
nr:hypothetical protein [Saprospiraceae bacterium]